MYISRLKLKNWRNFREIDIPFKEYTYLLGANATGKSNLLDVFRFLRDVSKTQGGGLQKAVKDRGSLSKLRCLHARKDTEVLIEIDFIRSFEDKEPSLKYILGFSHEGVGAQRVIITQERVWDADKIETANKGWILNRPIGDDKLDKTLLTQSYLEQIQTNRDFREIAHFFSGTTYLHLVPQLLKYAHLIGGRELEDDPFGQGFLERIARVSANIRNARLRRINKALKSAIPHFQELRFEQDEIGRPHLAANYIHHRPKGAWQREDQFSDGTLRLIGLLWSMLEGSNLLLIEEPELSLNDAIIKNIPYIMEKLQRDNKHKQQFIISTHSETLLTNEAIDPSGVLLLETTDDGTTVRTYNNIEKIALKSGLSVADVLLPKARPRTIEQLVLDL